MKNLLILLIFALFTFGGYAWLNQPLEAPAWPARIPGFAFSPFQEGQSPFQQRFPDMAELESDLSLLSGSVFALRTYTVSGALGNISRLAAQYKMNLALGAWLDGNLAENDRELERLIKITEQPPYNVVRVIAGNETLLRKDLQPAQMIAYLDSLRQRTKIPVSTAEPWHVWIKHPELAAHVDYIAVHMLPYWEGVALDEAVDYIVEKMDLLKAVFPGKPVVIAEVGWPSNGRSIKQARASEANEAVFLRNFINRAEKEGYVYYVMEAFDQPWKSRLEGDVGAYWGVYDVGRQPKFEFTRPIVPLKQWRIMAVASAALAAFLVLFLLLDSGRLQGRGRVFLVSVAFAASTLIIWVIHEHTLLYHSALSSLVGLMLILGVAGVWFIILIEAHEWAEVLWKRELSAVQERQAMPLQDVPFVSIHVPAYNEPAGMMMETLWALAELDYPAYEVIVVDNNTPDETTWRPVEALCRSLGEHFRFFHVSPLAGYKAGALNFALQKTDPAAEIIAVIDSDYQVDNNWLRQLIPEFQRPAVAIVQAPQDYRDSTENAFKAMCYAEYKGFFHIGMVTRNERNAIIQHGTMTLVRRCVLEEVGGWGETTITEDAELGLRIFRQGHQAVYSTTSFGKGLMPDTFIDYKKQRHRWAYGAMQILREHAAALFWPSSGLRPGQRYHFVAGWLPWMADGLNLVFTLLAIAWSLLMLAEPLRFNAPHSMVSLVPILFFAFKLLKMLVLYRSRLHAGLCTALAAALAGLALSHTIARAVLSGLLIGRRVPFLRTPKQARRSALLQAFNNAREEAGILLLLALLCGMLLRQQGWVSQELLLWCGVLGVQSVPYLSAVLVSLISVVAKQKAGWLKFGLAGFNPG